MRQNFKLRTLALKLLLFPILVNITSEKCLTYQSKSGTTQAPLPYIYFCISLAYTDSEVTAFLPNVPQSCQASFCACSWSGGETGQLTSTAPLRWTAGGADRPWRTVDGVLCGEQC